jgi:N-acetylmuramoyl-L-alanine amidase
MRVKGTTVQQIILGAALLAALCWNLAQANEIKDLQLIEGANGTRAELHLQGDVAFRTLSLPNPDRFVVDLPETVPAATLQLPAPVGMIRSVRRGQPAPGTTRIVFDLAAPVKPLPRLERGPEGVRLVLEWPGSGARPNLAAPSTGVSLPTATAAVAAPPQNPAASSVAAPTGPTVIADKPAVPPQAPASSASSAVPSAVAASSTPALADKPATPSVDPQAKPAVPPSDAAVPAGRGLRDLRAGTRPLIVAIDAGHGGQDPGAIGPTGKREKDVTLAIARELARQVNATPGLKAVLTRDTDMFLPLTRRTQLARQAKADIFISIHADAAENRAARGSSVYVLSLRGASDEAARWLAERENAADLMGGVSLDDKSDVLASVLLDVTQKEAVSNSVEAADSVLAALRRIGTVHRPRVQHAGFVVLKSPDIPSMLVETAFISNASDERRLRDPDHQQRVADAIHSGVRNYFYDKPPPGTKVAAVVAARQGGGVRPTQTLAER